MYEFMAGVRPTSPGYHTVDIRPHISKVLGPSSVRAAVQTVRGTVLSNWTRYGSAPVDYRGTKLLSMHVEVPAGTRVATIRVPLMGLKASEAHVQLQMHASGGHVGLSTLWKSGVPKPVAGMFCKAVVMADGEEALEMNVGAGMFDWTVSSL